MPVQVDADTKKVLIDGSDKRVLRCCDCCDSDKNFTDISSITISVSIAGTMYCVGAQDGCMVFSSTSSRSFSRVDQDLDAPTDAGAGEFKRWCKDGDYHSSFYKAGFGDTDGFADDTTAGCNTDCTDPTPETSKWGFKYSNNDSSPTDPDPCTTSIGQVEAVGNFFCEEATFPIVHDFNVNAATAGTYTFSYHNDLGCWDYTITLTVTIS